MTREQQYWEDTQEALSRVFDRCEEIDPQSGYDMLEDIQFIRGFINKHKPRTEEQEPRKGHWILDETDNSITCDKCGCLIWANDISNGEAYYCPNCGAKMAESEST